jgi:hypothetical protein
MRSSSRWTSHERVKVEFADGQGPARRSGRTWTCCPASDCVEVRIIEVATRVRDSKNPTGGHLTLDPAAFAVFVAGLDR